MFRRKTRRNIRSKRIFSRKNRNFSRRMKGGDPLSTAHAIEINSSTLCGYAVIRELYSDGKITEDDLTKVANKLMLYRIGDSDDYPVSEQYPNPMSIQAIIDTHNPVFQFLYVDSNVKCSATVI